MFAVCLLAISPHWSFSHSWKSGRSRCWLQNTSVFKAENLSYFFLMSDVLSDVHFYLLVDQLITRETTYK